MTIQSHLVELERKHRALEKELSKAIAHPSTTDDEIAALKRRKLALKDEISKFRVPELNMQ